VGHNGVMTCVRSHDKWGSNIFVSFSFFKFLSGQQVFHALLTIDLK